MSWCSLINYSFTVVFLLGLHLTRQVSISSTFYEQLFVQKCFAQLFSNYSLALWLFGQRISAQKLLVKCWWNWLLVKWLALARKRNSPTIQRNWICPIRQSQVTCRTNNISSIVWITFDHFELNWRSSNCLCDVKVLK